MRLGWIASALCLLLGCSSSGSKGDAATDGKAGAGGGAGGASDAGLEAAAGAGGQSPDGSDPCRQPLSRATGCEASFEAQVTANPCDPTMPATMATCSHYKTWELLIIGSETCIYDTAAAGALVGERSCGDQAANCPGGCTTFGVAESEYAACNGTAPACPP